MKILTILFGFILSFNVFAAGQLALSFDDGGAVSSWRDYRHIIDKYPITVTFYVSQYSTHVKPNGLTDFLLEMQAAGHRIGYHGTKHVAAEAFINTNGMQEYINVEILPDLVHMRDDGFVLEHFAYPFGVFTRESDLALAGFFKSLRYTLGGSNYLGLFSVGNASRRLTHEAIPFGNGYPLIDIYPVIDEATVSNNIVAVFTHKIGYYTEPYHVTPEDLEALIIYALDKGLVIKPID